LGIWRVNKTGGLTLMRQVDIGPVGAETIENHHVYVSLPEPLTIYPDPVPYVLNGVKYYERWVVGVWIGTGNAPSTADYVVISPQTAATLNIEQAGIIRFQNYTYTEYVFPFPGDPPYYGAPWGQTSPDYYFGVNFKYNVLGPAADAGPDVAIYTSEQAMTVIAGTATHTVAGTSMEYRWLEGSNVLKDWTAVVDGQANLTLAAVVPALSIGSHTLTLEVKDTALTVSDTMILVVANTPPEGQPSPTYQVLEIGADAVVITASVADFDGDAVNYQWVKDGVTIGSGSITPPAGGAPAEIDDLAIPAGDPRFPLGSNEIQFVVNDGVNPAVTVPVIVMMQDTTSPTLAPTPSITMLWPPNHQLIPVTIWTNGEDNGGGSPVLTASVQCSEDDGGTEPDWYIDSIDNTLGTIALRLRSERSGSGDGRVYTVTITANDGSGNQSTATVDIRVPHDKRKK